MNKILLSAGLLLFAHTTHTAQQALPFATTLPEVIDQYDRDTVATDSFVEPENLAEIFKAYFTIQKGHQGKVLFINQILDNEEDGLSLDQKITQIKALLSVIDDKIKELSGWLYNSAQSQKEIDWLQEQKGKIAYKLSLLEWQSKTFAEKATHVGIISAKYAALAFGIIMGTLLVQQKLGYFDTKHEQLAPTNDNIPVYLTNEDGSITVLLKGITHVPGKKEDVSEEQAALLDPSKHHFDLTDPNQFNYEDSDLSQHGAGAVYF